MGNQCGCFAGARTVVAGRPDERRRNSGSEALINAAGSSRGLVTIAENKGKHPEAFYEMDKKPCGSGAFGTVKKARNKMSGQVVAIKQLDRKSVDTVVLRNEIEINMMMDHPNIARMFDTFEDNKFVWIALEVCDGGEMFDLIIEQGSVTEVESSLLMEQIFRAINYLHSHNVAHRDLKPENFLLAKKGKTKGKSDGVPLQDNTLKVIDFGIAKKFNKASEPLPFRTKAGTPYYIAPEILSTKGRYDEKCDIWSCGVILFILLTGVPPFSGDNDPEILEAVKRQPVPLNISEMKYVSEDAKKLIKRCCERDVSKRYSAQEALAVPWVTNRSKKIQQDGNAGVNVVAKLKQFSAASRFKKAAIHIIAHHIDDHQINQLRHTFTQMDTNGDGELSIEEIKAGCKKTGLGDVEDIAKIFAQLDTDGNGSIGYSEFLAAMMDQNKLVRREQCWEAFRVFDKDGNGRITKTEFNEIMKDFNTSGVIDVDKKELLSMFQEADRDGDGEIDFEEFVAMMNKGN